MSGIFPAARWVRVGLSPYRNSQALWISIKQIRRYRELLREMVHRDLSAAHAMHGFGALWIFIHPLVIVATYLLIFGFVLGSKLAINADFPGDYSAYILASLVPWLMLQAAIVRGPGALLASANLVKQVVFPIEVLPIAATIAATIPHLPALALVILYKAYVGGLSWMVLLLPVVLVMHGILAIGLSFALSAITPFFRDLRDIVTVFTSIVMYLMPTVYLPDWMPSVLRPLIYSNPFSYVVWVYQDVLFFGTFKHPYAWVVTLLFALLSLGLGYRTFEKLKPYYGNAL
ncbi:ABC transporter permease [Bradyrhizobium brasilense]|uniref:ABC transporter permease n=1 Tax=Bradyrhizobium brasilense TaxID=1419277 RepID=UPI001E2DC63D|nr:MULTISPECIES: ABC transporter permease [Bradyrhizobium]MCC8945696.1 ABC transporter permease [Bradyrhizobium brasilense]WFU35739.1 ABC transporter permease [Bradyrhizobium australafricanum]